MQKNNTALTVMCSVDKGCSKQFSVQLMDNNHRTIDQCQCRSNCRVRFLDLTPGDYAVYVYPCLKDGFINPLGMCRWLNLAPDCSSTQFFIFNQLVPCIHPLVHVDFTLADAYYHNLPIKKGELILWPTIQ